jgi:hypothetical protein
VYLNELDHYIEKILKKERYVRYVDDFVLFDEDKEKLKRDMQSISLFSLENLNLQIATHKTIVINSNIGIDFLGYYIKPSHTLVRRKVVQRFRYKFCQVLDENGFVDIADISMIRSYVGHFSHANSWGLRKKFNL